MLVMYRNYIMSQTVNGADSSAVHNITKCTAMHICDYTTVTQSYLDHCLFIISLKSAYLIDLTVLTVGVGVTFIYFICCFISSVFINRNPIYYVHHSFISLFTVYDLFKKSENVVVNKRVCRVTRNQEN